VWLAIPEGHALAGCELISPEQFAAEPFIAHPIEYEMMLAENGSAFAPPGDAVRRVSRVSDIVSALILVASGAGLTAVPKSVTHVGIAGVTYRKIGGPPRAVDYVAVYRKSERSPAVKAFIALLRARHRAARKLSA
jgi:DNA-binding transcriptional LysR family regulator